MGHRSIPRVEDLAGSRITHSIAGDLSCFKLTVTPRTTRVIGAHLMLARRSIAGSSNGGVAETQEMLDFCAQHGIVSDVEVVPMQAINEAFDRLEKNDVKYRFVIDMTTLTRP